MFSKSADASLPTPSQAEPPRWPEGVETGWEPPDRSGKAVGEGEGTVRTTNALLGAAAKAEVVWDQESPGSSPGGATSRTPASVRRGFRLFTPVPGVCAVR
jgi:hypothetical protein